MNKQKEIGLFTIEAMKKRLQDPLYLAKLVQHMKLNTKSKVIFDNMLEYYNIKTEKYISKYLLPLVQEEERQMALEMKKEIKQKSDLNEDELQLLTKIVNDKYSVGSFAGMVFNKYVELHPELFNVEMDCPIKLTETAVRIRKLIHDMSYQ